LRVAQYDNWKISALGERAEEVRDLYEPNKEEESLYIGLEHIEQQSLRITAIGSSSDTISTKKIFQSGDILFGSLRPYFRKVVRPKFGGVCSTDITVIMAKENTDQGFLQYFIANQEFIDHASNISSGTRMPRANWKVLAKSEWRFPLLPTQRKIAAILSAYDDLIENNLQRIKILEEIAKALYREWFVKFRFPGHEKTRMVDSPMGKIPEGWELKTVGDTFEILGGGTPSKKIEKYWAEGDIMWYVPSDLTASKTMFMDSSSTQITELGLTKSSARLFSPFSVMMTSRATLGVIAINTTEASTNQGFITCLPNERFPLHNLYHWLMENVETFISLSSGATFKEITKGVFKTIEMVVPAKNIARAFEDNVELLAEHVLNLQRKNEALRRTRDLLLPKLISGELDVSDLDIKTGGHMQ